MKRLTLVRHASAESGDPRMGDFVRPLNRRGLAEAQAAGRRLAELDLVPDLLGTSTAVRAQQTAEILTRSLQLPAERVRQEQRLYLAAPNVLLGIVKEAPEQIGHLMLVGHNPGLSELAASLAHGHHTPDLATCAVCTMMFDTDVWYEVGPGSGTHVYLESPPFNTPGR